MNVAGRKMVVSIVHVRQARLQGGHRRLDVARDLQRVAVRLLLDDQHQAVAAIDHRVADRGREPLHHLGDVADAQRVRGRARRGRRRRRRGAGRARPHDDLPEIVGGGNGGEVGNRQPLLRRSRYPPAATAVPFAGGGHDVGERDVVGCAGDRDRRAPAAAGRAGPRSRRWRRRESPSAAAGWSTGPGSTPPPGTGARR